jgi:integrase
MAGWGAKVGTMSRRLSAIKFAHSMRNVADPTEHARVIAVWEGIRREHSAPPEQATPLMPPDLQTVLDACPQTRTFKTRGRPAEPSRAGARDRALIMVGFVAALRRSELVALDAEHLSDHPRGMVIAIPRSKTNQSGEQHELVVLPRAGDPARCPVTLLEQWLQLAGITAGAVFRPVSKANRPLPRRLTAAAANDLLQTAVLRAGVAAPAEPETRRCTRCRHLPTTLETREVERCPQCGHKLPPRDFGGYSAHSLRAGFVTYAHLRGASDRAIAHQTRHRSLASIGTYVRVENAWLDNAALDLGL